MPFQNGKAGAVLSVIGSMLLASVGEGLVLWGTACAFSEWTPLGEAGAVLSVLGSMLLASLGKGMKVVCLCGIRSAMAAALSEASMGTCGW